jgi:hypothetical protein
LPKKKVGEFLKKFSPPTKKKLLIAVASYRSPKVETTKGIYRMMHTPGELGLPYDVDLRMTSHTSTIRARNEHMEYFLEHGHDACLMVDDDMQWPVSDAITSDGTNVTGFCPLIRLLERDKDVISALCTNRKIPTEIMAGHEEADGTCRMLNTPEEVMEPGVVPIDFFGFGMVLIRRRAVLKMLDHYGPKCNFWFAEWNTYRSLPAVNRAVADRIALLRSRPQRDDDVDTLLDEIEDLQRKGTLLGQDFAFCKRARMAGVELWLDRTFDVHHIGDYGYSRIDWLGQYNYFQERLKQQQKQAAEG